jgi:hypothetical protein
MSNTQSDIQDLETEAIEKLAGILKKPEESSAYGSRTVPPSPFLLIVTIYNLTFMTLTSSMMLQSKKLMRAFLIS